MLIEPLVHTCYAAGTQELSLVVLKFRMLVLLRLL